MRIDIKKIVRPLPLTEYAPEYVDDDGTPITLMVWVNPPRAMTEERVERSQAGQKLKDELDTLKIGDDASTTRANEILAEIANIGQESMDWLSEILSQGAEETRMSHDDVAALVEAGHENDPVLYQWILSRAWQMILEHRILKKKD